MSYATAWDQEQEQRPEQGRRGLCRTCSQADTCTFPRSSDRPLLECDELDGVQRLPLRSLLFAAGAERPRSAHREEDENAGPKGLCRTCENRFDCTFPRPEGGVWRCEEYV